MLTFHLFCYSGVHHERTETSNDNVYYGYQEENEEFRTVMAQNCDGGCPRVNHYSNPDVMYNGMPTGTENQNVAKWLNDRRFVFQSFNGPVYSPDDDPEPDSDATSPPTSSPTSPPTSFPTQGTQCLAKKELCTSTSQCCGNLTCRGNRKTKCK